MIIGFDGSRTFLKERTGTENYSYQLLKALLKVDRGNTYHIYTRSHITDDTVVQLMKLPNVKIVKISWPRFWTQGGLGLQTFKDNLDVLFVPAHTLPLIRKKGLKTVVTVHDLGSEYLPSMHQIKQRLYLSIMQRYQLKGATQIIAVSEATKKDLVRRLGIDSKKIKVVYESYDKKLFKPIKDNILVNSLRQYGVEPGKYFLFVGTVQPRKNLERVIKAFSIYLKSARLGRKAPLARPIARYGFVSRQNLSKSLTLGVRSTSSIALTDPSFASCLVIVGSKGWLSGEIYKLPKELGIEDKVKFLGYVTEKDLPALYSGALALVFPSLFEGFGLPILEAQACGCPVVTSNVSSMPEVAGKGAILVNPYSEDDIVKAMTRMMNKELRIKLIKHGLENIKRFSWEKCAEETFEVLDEAVH